MKKDAHSAARAFVNLFSREQTDKAQLDEFKAEMDNDVIHSQLRFAEMIYPDAGSYDLSTITCEVQIYWH